MQVENILPYQVRPSMRSSEFKQCILRKIYRYTGGHPSGPYTLNLMKFSKWFDGIYEDIPFLLVPRMLFCAFLIFTGYVFQDLSKMQQETMGNNYNKERKELLTLLYNTGGKTDAAKIHATNNSINDITKIFNPLSNERVTIEYTVTKDLRNCLKTGINDSTEKALLDKWKSRAKELKGN